MLTGLCQAASKCVCGSVLMKKLRGAATGVALKRRELVLRHTRARGIARSCACARSRVSCLCVCVCAYARAQAGLLRFGVYVSVRSSSLIAVYAAATR